MKPVIRYQSQLLYRRSYKPLRVIRIRPSPKTILFPGLHFRRLYKPAA
jgi:hypothetical protein